MTGRLCLNNGRFAFLGMEAQFPAPGYPLYGPIYLQRVAGFFNLPRQEMNAEALLSGGPQLSFPPFAPGPYYLVTLKGSITISGLGYFQTSAELRLLHGPPGLHGRPPGVLRWLPHGPEHGHRGERLPEQPVRRRRDVLPG